MIDIDKVLKIALEKDASDVHLICGLKPILRIRRELIEYEDDSILTEDDMYEIYDYFVRGIRGYRYSKKNDLPTTRFNISYREN